MFCKDFDLLPKASPTVAFYAYGLALVVLTAFLRSESVKKTSSLTDKNSPLGDCFYSFVKSRY